MGDYGKPSFKTPVKLDKVQVKWTMYLCWKALVQRDWFCRAWVVQEAALSSHVVVMCAYYSIPWNELVMALSCAPSVPVRPLGGFPLPSHVVVIERLRREIAEQRISLQDIFLRNSSCKAIKSPDRVYYALLGHVTEVELKQLKRLGRSDPDYELGFSTLCRQVAISIMKKSSNLDILSGPVGNPLERAG